MRQALILLLLILICSASCAERKSEADEWYTAHKKLYFGVPVHVRFKGPDPILANKVWQYLESIDEHFNDYRDDSEIGKINKGGKGIYDISPIMRDALTVSYQAHAVTDGAFDITVGPLRRLWKGAAKSGTMPSQDDIARSLSHVGLEHLWLDDRSLHINKENVALDFGGIVKGFAVDHAMQMLIEAGKTDAMVQVGGETAAIGISPRGSAHAFAIPHPQNPAEMLHVVQDPGTGYSGCTSANYRLPIIINGKPFYHIFDPRTGEPCSVHVLSVSVVFPQTGRNALADALSTSGVVLGPKQFITTVEALGGSCLLIEQAADGSIIQHTSANWYKFLRVK